MPFQLSPGVAVIEKDFTSIVPAVATSIGAFAGKFDWGPVLEPITITSEDELVRRFGTPNNNNFESFFTAANFLSYSNNLLTVRQEITGMKNAVVTPTNGLATVSVTNSGYGYPSTDAAPAVEFYTENILTSITVTDGGSGYVSAPTVTIEDPDGVGAFATASISGGKVIAVNVTRRGYGYTDPTISFSGGSGSGATATAVVAPTLQEEGGVLPLAHAVLSGGAITNIALSTAGSGYISQPTVSIIAAEGDTGHGATATVTRSGGAVLTANVTSGGTGYVSPTAAITGGGGMGAAATVQVTLGVITGITITDGGTGYLTPPTITISDSSGSGVIVGSVSISGSTITGITVTNGGAGYTQQPTVSISGGLALNGVTAVAGQCTIGPSTITSIVIDEEGSGLSAPPVVIIGDAPMNGITALATATVAPLGVAILNAQYYSANFINGGGVVGEWAAKYPGALGNTLKVSMADRDTYGTWAYKDEFDAAPGTSEQAARIGGSNDEMHIIVIDEDGYISGVENTVLEKFALRNQTVQTTTTKTLSTVALSGYGGLTTLITSLFQLLKLTGVTQWLAHDSFQCLLH
jgi:hypothetical protein